MTISKVNRDLQQGDKGVTLNHLVLISKDKLPTSSGLLATLFFNVFLKINHTGPYPVFLFLNEIYIHMSQTPENDPSS